MDETEGRKRVLGVIAGILVSRGEGVFLKSGGQPLRLPSDSLLPRSITMPTLLEVARHEIGRLRAISRKLSELKLPAIKDETDQLQVIVEGMERKLAEHRQKVDGRQSVAA